MKLLRSILVLGAVTVLGTGICYAGGSKKPTPEDVQHSIEHQEKGNMLDEQGNTVEALKEYEKALSYDPEDTNTLFNMGTSYLKINKPTEAAKAFEALLKIDGKDTEAYNLLGLAYRGCGKTKDAIKTWEKSLSIDPGQPMPKKFIEEAKGQ